MKILGLYGEDYPWDVRVEKLLSGLQAENCETHLICRNQKRSPKYEKCGIFNCRRVLAPGYPYLLHSALSIPSPFNPVWSRSIGDAISEINPDVLVVRDLPLSPLGIRLARHHGIPVIVDMAENHPAMWKNVIANDQFPIRSWLLKNPHLARKLEKKVAQSADLIFVVVEEMRDHLIAMGGDPNRIKIVSNTPQKSTFENSPAQPETGDSNLDLIYVGHITRSRGLRQVLQAVHKMKEKSHSVAFHIVGSGDYRPALQAYARELGITDSVRFYGWVDHAQVPAIVSRCNIGIIPHLKTEHTDTTVPNKLFDFMAASLPVVVSNADPMRRIVMEENCGMSFECGNLDNLVETLNSLQSAQERKRMGSNGNAAVVRRYHWEYDLATAQAALKSLVGGR